MLKIISETAHLDLKAKTAPSKVTSTTRQKREEQEEKSTCREQAVQAKKSGLAQQPYRLKSPAHNSKANKITKSSSRLFHSLETSFVNQHS